ncbi:hypothetical protein H4R34_000805 [Dimargaris verticillata]|uniref:CNNM transmembrane domain-containing protein n=1 Tax=Dimargaris verticillata TaxID=2761393 RepID=A0A9W8B6H6_9FUNG|nr:hypothetical protein H4R34_000805 [Dimargaris verticillata]
MATFHHGFRTGCRSLLTLVSHHACLYLGLALLAAHGPTGAWAYPTNAAEIHSAATPRSSEERPSTPIGSPEFWIKFIAVVVLVLFGGLVAGLTLGLMSLDETNLHILSISGDERQRKYAARIQPIRKNGHWLLVTLLLTNTLINETLPIIMDSIFGGGVTAVLASTALILVFGEVIPQSVCARHGLVIGAFFAWPVRILRWILAPLGYPIACLLDWVLGKNHGMIYRKAELKELVSMHDASHGGSLTRDEITIIRGVLELNEKLVKDVMTSFTSVFTISIDSIMDRDTMTKIVRAGHSRVPIYQGDHDNIVGVFLVKTLILIDPDDCIPLRNLKINRIPSVTTKTSLFDILNIFQEGGSHMALVYEAPEIDYQAQGVTVQEIRDSLDSYTSMEGAQQSSPILKDSQRKRKLLGVITLEDVIEELIQEEIVDETDVFVDNRNKIKVVSAARQLSLDRLALTNPSKSTLHSMASKLMAGKNPSKTTLPPTPAVSTPGPSTTGANLLSPPQVKIDDPPSTVTEPLAAPPESIDTLPDHDQPPTRFNSRDRLIPMPHSSPLRPRRIPHRKGTAFSSRRRELVEGAIPPNATRVRPVSEYLGLSDNRIFRRDQFGDTSANAYKSLSEGPSTPEDQVSRPGSARGRRYGVQESSSVPHSGPDFRSQSSPTLLYDTEDLIQIESCPSEDLDMDGDGASYLNDSLMSSECPARPSLTRSRSNIR